MSASKILSGYFTWPAGMADRAISITAIVVLQRLLRDPRFATSGAFLTWNLLGLLGFIITLSMGAAGQVLGEKLGMIGTMSIAQLPLVLIAVYLVPVFTMLHLSGLFQRARAAAETAA